MPYRTFFAVWLFLLLAACRPQGPAVEIGGEYYRVEIADTDAKRQKGLMFRQNLPADHGMLFIFPHQAPRAFWMKNTRIPLDILYFDRNLKLVDQQRNVPPCHQQNCPSYPSAKAARYVLELNAGEAKRLGLESGDSLRLYGINSEGNQ